MNMSDCTATSLGQGLQEPVILFFRSFNVFLFLLWSTVGLLHFLHVQCILTAAESHWSVQIWFYEAVSGVV
jgi:hypothetical protein